MARGIFHVWILAAFAVLLSTPVAAAPIVIDFEAFSNLESITNQISGVTFTDTTVLTAGISLNESDFPPASGVNAAFDDSGPVRIDFLNPLAAFSTRVTYAVQVSLAAFDAANNLLGTISSAFSSNLASGGDLGSAPNELLQATFNGIAYVTITGDSLGGSFVFDDVMLTPSETAAAVPEPATLTLLSIGATALLTRARRNSRRNYLKPTS